LVRTVRDETLRVEVGPAVLCNLAVENVDLGQPALSRAVRRLAIAWRVNEPVLGRPDDDAAARDDVALADRIGAVSSVWRAA